MENNDGTWPRGLDGPSWDPNKRYGEPMRLSDIIKKLNGMEGFLMHEAYMALIHDNVMNLYPTKEYEKKAVNDMIDYFCEREEYEKCAELVKYLKKGDKVYDSES